MRQHYRRARVTLYIDVPVFTQDENGNTQLNNDDRILDSITHAVEEHTGCITNCEAEITSESFEDIEMTLDEYVESPAGFILPNGQMILESDIHNGLVHLSLARAVYDMCEAEGVFDNVPPATIDRQLELAGIIRVHGMYVRYVAHEGTYWRSCDVTYYTPDPTPEQIDALSDYCDVYGYNGRLCFDGGQFSMSDIRQMDQIAFRHAFNYCLH